MLYRATTLPSLSMLKPAKLPLEWPSCSSLLGAKVSAYAVVENAFDGLTLARFSLKVNGVVAVGLVPLTALVRLKDRSAKAVSWFCNTPAPLKLRLITVGAVGV